MYLRYYEEDPENYKENIKDKDKITELLRTCSHHANLFVTLQNSVNTSQM